MKRRLCCRSTSASTPPIRRATKSWRRGGSRRCCGATASKRESSNRYPGKPTCTRGSRATAEYWSVDPFSGLTKDGYIWGRGSLDMKGEAIAQLMTMLILKRAHIPLRRDIIFLATSDEEIGAGVGAAWIAEHQAPLVNDAEFLLNEGGLTRANGQGGGGVDFYGIGTTEKSPFWLDVTAHGTAGHGSRPTPDNPVHRLVRALTRIAAWQTPLTVTPAAERSFRDLATIERDTTVRRRLSDIRAALRDSVAARYITADPTYK